MIDYQGSQPSHHSTGTQIAAIRSIVTRGERKRGRCSWCSVMGWAPACSLSRTQLSARCF